ncbi:MAG: DUF4342 domain-containing protein [Nitrososphaerales archaeon]
MSRKLSTHMPKYAICGTVAEATKYCSNSSQVAGTREIFTVSASNLIDSVKELVKNDNNVSSIAIKDERDYQLLKVPIASGPVDAVLSPWLPVLGIIANFATRCTVVIERTQ